APDLPVELEELIHCMLAKSADQRPTMQAVTTVLARLGGTPTNPGLGFATPPALDRTLPLETGRDTAADADDESLRRRDSIERAVRNAGRSADAESIRGRGDAGDPDSTA